MDYINGPTSNVRRRDTNRARSLVGLATRRELASKATWQRIFRLDDADSFRSLLQTLDVADPGSRKLPGKAINRLRAEANSRGLSWAEAVTTKTPATIETEPSRIHAKPVSQPLVWTTIGKERDFAYLTDDDVRSIHEELVDEFASHKDPISPPGVRDGNLLGSALSRPHTSMGDIKKYPSVEMAAAALLHALIHDHPFHNGNKRTALVSMLAFLDLNRLIVTCAEDALFKFVIRIAQHSIVPSQPDQYTDREVLEIAKWIRQYSRPIELGDRPIPFRRLRKLLTRYECTYGPLKGTQIYISRTIEKKGILSKVRKQTVSTQTSYRDEGRELRKTSIAKIRKDLQLDEPNGIDSASFYDNAPAAAGEFIIKFRKTLDRLARL